MAFVKFASLCRKIVLFIFLILIGYILLANINADSTLSYKSLFVLACMVSLVFCFVTPKIRDGSKDYLFSLINNKKILICCLILGILMRVAPLLFDFTWILENNEGDCAIHFFGSQELAMNGVLTETQARYEAVFLQLYAYTVTLSIFVKIFKDITVAIVLSNILFDSISVIFLSRILKKLHKKPNLGILLWWLNPFFIVMCWLPMAVIVVNTILVITTYLGFLLISKHNTQKKCNHIAALFGLAIFVGNLYRPVFYVILIALVITLWLQMIEKRLQWKSTVAIVFIAAVCALLPNEVFYSKMTSINGFKVPESKAGWNFFVGANYESNGTWSPDDNYYFWCELMPEVTIDQAEEILFEEGLQRYKRMSPVQLCTHLLNKLNVLYADVGNSVHDLQWTFSITAEKYSLITRVTTMQYYLLLIALSTQYFSKRKSSIIFNEAFFPTLTFVGFSMAYMLVEVMNRYSSMPIALLILIAAIGLDDNEIINCKKTIELT